MKRLFFTLLISLLLVLTSCKSNTLGNYSYNIYFDGDGGTLIDGIESQTVSSLSEIIYPIYFKEGYEFIGFDKEIEKLENNITLKAVYEVIEEIKYNIYFNGDGGTLLDGKESQIVSSLSEIIYPTYHKEGYDFLGFDKEIEELEDGITLKALYKKIQYSVYFNGENGTLQDGDEYQKVDTFDDIIYPTYEYKGYFVLGYSVDIQDYNVYITVNYERIPNYYFLKIYLDDELIEDELYQKGDIIDIDMPEMENFSITYDFEIPDVMPDKDVVIHSYWKIERCKLTVNYNADTIGIRNYTFDYGTLVEENQLENRASFRKTGHIFIGWDTEFPIVLEEDTTINVLWEPYQYTLVFDSHGADYVEFERLTFQYGDTIILPKASKESFKFGGWYYGTTKLDSDTIQRMCPSGTYNIDAKWIFGKAYYEFGRYPQSHVSDLELIEELNKITETNSIGYYEYNGEEYMKILASPVAENVLYYKDGSIVKSGEEWFKVESIKWKVVGNDKYILSPINLLDVCYYDLYGNPYSVSHIRSFLNNEFKNMAFKAEEQNKLLNFSKINTEFYVEGNKVTTITTAIKDDVFIKSLTDESSVNLELTDYAIAKGAIVTVATKNNQNYYYGNWWVMEQAKSDSLTYYQIYYSYIDDKYLSARGAYKGICINFQIAIDL